MTIRVGINGFGRIGRNFFRAAKRSWAQDNLRFPSRGPGPDPVDITGSVKKEEKKEEAPKPAAPATEVAKPDGVVVFPEQNPQSVSPSERAILERLQARRQELEQRAREIEIRLRRGRN